MQAGERKDKEMQTHTEFAGVIWCCITKPLEFNQAFKNEASTKCIWIFKKGGMTLNQDLNTIKLISTT
jgi:hypothetical protein